MDARYEKLDDPKYYEKVVSDLSVATTEKLRSATRDPDLVREAILFYLTQGYELGLSSSELIDFFCVSTPNILEDAGYEGDEGDLVVSVFDEIHAQLRRK